MMWTSKGTGLRPVGAYAPEGNGKFETGCRQVLNCLCHNRGKYTVVSAKEQIN